MVDDERPHVVRGLCTSCSDEWRARLWFRTGRHDCSHCWTCSGTLVPLHLAEIVEIYAHYFSIDHRDPEAREELLKLFRQRLDSMPMHGTYDRIPAISFLESVE